MTTSTVQSGYWQDLYARRAASLDLDVVICPGHTKTFNRLVARCQAASFSRAQARIGPLSGRRTLDVGCGIGRWLERMVREGAEATGVDLSADAVHAAQRRCPSATVWQRPATQLGFSDGAFDLVTSVTVIQHLPRAEQSAAIAEMARCVKPGGFLLLMERVGWPTPEHMRDGHVTYPRPPSWWIAEGQRAGVELVMTERHLLLPLINNVYLPLERWGARGLRALLRRGTAAAALPGPAGSAQPRSQWGLWEERVNRACLGLLSWPSGVLEDGLIHGLSAQRWVHQRWLGNCQTFLFQSRSRS